MDNQDAQWPGTAVDSGDTESDESVSQSVEVFEETTPGEEVCFVYHGY
jgi:hypothetical protein